MRKVSAILLSLMILVSGCEFSTEYGKCVGVFSLERSQRKNPNLEYEMSVRNAVLGLVFFEMFFVPTVIWAAEATFCPYGKIEEKKLDTGIIQLIPPKF